MEITRWKDVTSIIGNGFLQNLSFRKRFKKNLHQRSNNLERIFVSRIVLVPIVDEALIAKIGHYVIAMNKLVDKVP